MVDESILKSKHYQTLIKAGWSPQILKDHAKKNIKNSPDPIKSSAIPLSAVSSSFISIKNLSKSFGNSKVLEDINLEIRPGEIFGIIGLSGAGKTTLLNLIVGFEEPDSGNIFIRTQDGKKASVYENSDLIKKTFGFATQKPSFYSKLTVKENLNYFSALYNIPFTKIVTQSDYLINLVSLNNSKNKVSNTLSGGMKKRLDIACSLVHNPKVLILDEPTADLDPLLRVQMWNLIKEINKRGTTIIVASHFIEEIEKYCERIAILKNRTIAEIGTCDELKNNYSLDYELQFRTASGDYDYLMNSLKKSKAVSHFTLKDGQLIIYTSKPKKTLEFILKKIDSHKDNLKSFNLSRPSLSEVFRAFVKK